MDGTDDYDDDVYDGDDDDAFPTDECEANSPEEDIQIARLAITEGDLPHAAFHVACALADNPLREDWKALLAAIIGQSDEPDALFEVDGDEVYIGIVAGRAFVLEQQRHFADAVALMGEAIEYDPRIPYITWVTEWLLRAGPEEVLAAAATDTLTEFLHGLLRSGALEAVDDSHREAFCRAFFHVAEAIPAGTGDFEYARCAILRRLEQYDRALAIATALHEGERSWRSAVCVAMALREMGETEKAMAAYREAADLDPTELTTYLDMGDLLLGAGEFAAAAKEFDKACIIEDESPWAFPSLLYCRCFSEEESDAGKSMALAELRSFAAANPDNERAADLLEHLQRLDESPYVDYLPEPQEALVHMVRHLLEEGSPRQTETFRVGLSHLEAPSAVMACRQSLNLFDEEPKCELALTVTHLQQPDPRACPGESIARLWRYEGFEASPAVAPPHSTEVTAAVTALAETPYQLDAWWRMAHQATAGWDDSRIAELLACMVHIPPSRIDTMPWLWIQGIQTAAAFLLAPLCARSWISSPTANPLLAICHGTKDWIINGAIIALTRLALEAKDPRICSDVTAAFDHLEKSCPDGGFCSYAHCLVSHQLQLPGNSAERLRFLEGQLRKIESPESNDGVS